MNDAIRQFRTAIQNAGLHPPEVIECDGRLHRFASNGKQNDDAGWYVLHDDDMPAGAFGDWRTGISETWHATTDRELSSDEDAARRAGLDKLRRESEAENETRQAEARRRAVAIWDAALPATDDHPYLRAKSVCAHGIRIHETSLVIPVRDGTELHSLQFIGSEGDKRFLRGGSVSGCYFSIGKLSDRLCIVEGYATGATIHEATGHAVAVAFNAGNVLPVARALRSKLPDIPLVICADDDVVTPRNPGHTKAREAAAAVGGLLAIPNFGPDRPDGVSDFNDLQRLRGAEVVRAAIEAATKPAGAPSSIQQWSSPTPLPDGLSPVDAFDVELLPPLLQAYVNDIAERMQCPPDFPAVAAMVALSSVVGRRVGIMPKRFDHWTVVPNLWGMVVGRPGIMKSPPLQEVMRPLQQLQSGAVQHYKNLMLEFEAGRIVAGEAERVAKEEIRKLLKGGRKAEAAERAEHAVQNGPREPICKRFVVNDATVEALGKILNENPYGVLHFRDELTGFFRTLDRQGHEADRAFYLECWNGDGSHTYDRIGRGTLHVEGACLSILGSIQPGPLTDLVRGLRGSGDDGLLQRFQLAVWPNSAKPWRNVDRVPDMSVRDEIGTVMRRLDGMGGDPTSIPTVRFSEAAQVLFDAWREQLEIRLRSESEHPTIEAHLAKYRSLVPSLALLIHLVAHSVGSVELIALERAIAWAEYLETHARRIYRPAISPDIDAARALSVRIRKGDITGLFALRDIYNKGWSGLATREEAAAAVRVLEDFDWLRSEQQETTGRPRTVYVLNPAVVSESTP